MEFKVQPKKLKMASATLRDTEAAIIMAELCISEAALGLVDISGSYREIQKSLKRIQGELTEAQKASASMKSAIGSIARKYETTEKILYMDGLMRNARNNIDPEWYKQPNVWIPLGLGLLSFPGTAIVGFPIGIGIIGLATGAFKPSAYYEVDALRTTVSGGGTLSLYDENGKFDPEAKLSAKAEFDAFYGKAGFEAGLLASDIEIKLGKVAAKGELGASLYDEDGNLDPALEAKVAAEATAAEGQVSTRVGDEENNIHAEAEGKVLTAEAEATARVSKDEFELGAKAGAYAATGSVKGGITIFGVKIDASLEGSAGGASVEAKAAATETSVTAKIGAGLLVGGGLEISVDWGDKSSSAVSHSGSVGRESEGNRGKASRVGGQGAFGGGSIGGR